MSQERRKSETFEFATALRDGLRARELSPCLEFSAVRARLAYEPGDVHPRAHATFEIKMPDGNRYRVFIEQNPESAGEGQKEVA